MSVIRENIKLKNQDINIKFTLSSNDDFYDYQQEISNISDEISASLINIHNDTEARKFKYKNTNSSTISFNFIDHYGSLVNNFEGAGFTTNEINNNRTSFLNSFFILDYYDTFDINIQRKIFTTYLTKLGATSTYLIDSSVINQLYYWYVPQSYVDIETGSTVTGYVKFSFYNSKNLTNSIIIFNNNDITTQTPERMFFKVELDLINKTWEFKDTTTITANQIDSNSAYANKVNNTVSKINNIKQIFPNGNSFILNSNNGSYELIK